MPDTHDYQVINDLARNTAWAHAPAVAYADYGMLLLAAVALGAYAWAWWRADAPALVAAGWAGLAGFAALAVNQVPVHVLNEPRPYAVMSQALVLVTRSNDPSAPSDHAVVAAAVATGLMHVHRRLGAVTWMLALLMAFDRVYVGAHYPSDVLLGLLEGTAIAAVGGRLARPLLDRMRQAWARTPARLLVQRPAPSRHI
jgi:membrane-associated phospholipid phosphatase